MSAVTASPAPTRSARETWLIVIALVSVYLVWGSTYLAIRYALESFAPFQMGGMRFVAAGVLMLAWLRFARGAPMPSARQWRNVAITGSLLLPLGNGLVAYAEQTVSSGLTAVAVAGMPLFAAIIAGLYGKWPHGRDWLGLGVGFSGVILLNLGSQMTGSPAGALALLIAPLAWAFGSVWSRHQDMPDPFMSTACQMLIGGAVMLLISAALGEPLPHQPTAIAIGAVIYLGIFGSIVGLTAYVYLLHHVRPALATSYAYVNPPIAVLLGVMFLHEPFGWLDAAAMCVILAGVVIILAQKR